MSTNFPRFNVRHFIPFKRLAGWELWKIRKGASIENTLISDNTSRKTQVEETDYHCYCYC